MKHPEQDLQRACVRHLRALPPPPKGPWWTACNTFPYRTPKLGAQAKALGLQPGTPDILVLWGGKFTGIELKAGKGVPSDVQTDTANAIARADGFYMVARTVDQFADCLRAIKPQEAA